jgi:hypothetical protein
LLTVIQHQERRLSPPADRTADFTDCVVDLVSDPLSVPALPQLRQGEFQQRQTAWLKLELVQDAVDETRLELSTCPLGRSFHRTTELDPGHRSEVDYPHLKVVTQAAIERNRVAVEVGA